MQTNMSVTTTTSIADNLLRGDAKQKIEIDHEPCEVVMDRNEHKRMAKELRKLGTMKLNSTVEWSDDSLKSDSDMSSDSSDSSWALSEISNQLKNKKSIKVTTPVKKKVQINTVDIDEAD